MYIAIANAIYSSTLQGSGGGFPKACFGLDYNAITSDFTFTRNSFATRVNEFGLIETVTNLGSDLVENGSFDELGSEQVVNGDFATDSDWTLVNGATISNDKLNIDYNLGNGSTTQTNVFTIGKTYKIEINVDNSSIGSARINNGVTATVLSNGLNTFYLEAVGAGIEIRNHVNFIGSIDNVSVKQVDPNDDWILSSATIEDSKLVINSVGGAMTYAFQSGLDLLANKTYEISFNATRVSGDTDLAFCSGPGNNVTGSPVISTSGLKSYNFTPTSTVTSFGIKRNSGGSGAVWEIDNIVVQEVIEDDIPRIDYTGSTFDVPVLSDELITNGDFENGDTDWVLNPGSGTAIVSNGKLNFTNSTSSGTQVTQRNRSYIVGKTYKITYTITDYVQGYVRLSVGNQITTAVSANGTFTEYKTYTSGLDSTYIYTANSTLSIDNVSVKEVTAYTTTDKGAFLLEPISTNEIAYSNDYTDSYWIKASSGSGLSPIVTSNYAISPDGTQNADRIQFDATTSGLGSDRSRIRTALSLSDVTDYTFSFYAKSTDGTDQQIGILFDNSQIAVKTVTSEWQRFEATQQQFGTASICGLDLRSSTASTSDILVYAIQVEELSYATSYIPSSGTTVTRAQETCVDATPTINSEEGVLYAEISALADDNSLRVIEINDKSSLNRVLFYYRSNDRIVFQIKISNITVLTQTIPSADVTSVHKLALLWSQDNFSAWLDGVRVGVATIGNTFASNTLTDLDFSDPFGGLNFYGRTKDLRVYCKALTDDELTELTTI